MASALRRLLTRGGPAIALCLLTLSVSGCPDDKRQIGESCIGDGQCETGLCFGECLSPDGDADGDGILNKVEAYFGSDPLALDSDGDGKPDEIEYGAATTIADSPSDLDGDGNIDAIESTIADNDGDCINDEVDDVALGRDTSEAHVTGWCVDAIAGICAGQFETITLGCAVVDGELVPSEPRCTFTSVAGYSETDNCDNDLDDNCDGQVNEGCPGVAIDADGDTFANDVDCDDNDPDTYPGAPSQCLGKDNDCSDGGILFHEGRDVLFVSRQGDASEADGSIDLPFDSIQAAIDAAQPGTTILIQGGADTYNETVAVTKDVVIEGGYTDCDFTQRSVDAPTRVQGDGAATLLVGDGGTVEASMLAIATPDNSGGTGVRVTGAAFTCTECLITSPQGNFFSGLAAGQGAGVTLINTIIDLAASAAASQATGVEVFDGNATVNIVNSVLRVAGGDAQTAVVRTSDDLPKSVTVLNTMLAVSGTGERVLFQVENNAPFPTVVGCDFTLSGAAPLRTVPDNVEYSLLDTNGSTVSTFERNVALGCAPTGAPWKMVDTGFPSCRDRGVDPTLAPYSLPHPALLRDRGGNPRGSAVGADGFYDIGPEEISGIPCTGDTDCADLGACVESRCPSGRCAFPPVTPLDDLDGDGLCAAEDDDQDGDGFLTAVDCDDADPDVYPGACDGILDDCSLAPTAAGGVIFVSASADPDGADGTRGKPFTTVQEGVNAAVAQGVEEVWVSAGTYNEAVLVQTSTITGPPVRVLGGFNDCDFSDPASPGLTEIVGPSNASYGMFLSGAITLERLSIRHQDGVNGTQAVIVDGGGILLQDCAITAAHASPGASDSAYGVSMNALSALHIRDSTIDITGGSVQYGISALVQGSTVELHRTTVTLDTAASIHAYGIQTGGISRMISSVVHMPASHTTAYGFWSSGNETTMVGSSILMDPPTTSGAALFFSGTNSGTILVNNLLHATSPANGVDYFVTGGAGSLSAWNNAFATFPLNFWNYGGPNTTTDPALINTCEASSGCATFDLQGNIVGVCNLTDAGNSWEVDGPCIDGGADPSPIVPLTVSYPYDSDIAGNPRPVGGWDIGASSNPDAACLDTDGDGVCNIDDPDDDNDTVDDGEDCAPLDGAVFPGADEQCGDGVINDCDASGGGTSPLGGGAVFYVSPTGQSDGDGSFNDPVDTIGAARVLAENATGPVIIAVAAGEYTEGNGGVQFTPAVPDTTILGGLDGSCDFNPGGGPSIVRAPNTAIRAQGNALTLQDLTLVVEETPGDLFGVQVGTNADVTLTNVDIVLPNSQASAYGVEVTASPTMTMTDVGIALGSAAVSSATIGVLGDPNLTIEGGRFVGGFSPSSNGLFIAQGTNPTLTVNRARFNTPFGGSAIFAGGGLLTLTNSMAVVVSPVGEAAALHEDGVAQVFAVGNYLAVLGIDSTAVAHGVRLTGTSSTDRCWYANNIVIVESGDDAYGFSSAPGYSVGNYYRNNAVYADGAGQSIAFYMAGNTFTVADFGGGNCSSVTACLSTQQNVAAKCDLDATAYLSPTDTACINAGLDPTSILGGAASAAVDIHGDPRPADDLWDIGPDEVPDCDADPDCAGPAGTCAEGGVCLGSKCAFPNAGDADNDFVCDAEDGCPNSDPSVDGMIDADGDGCFGTADCDDNNAAIYPGAEEICDDGIDNDCDGGGVMPGTLYVELGASGVGTSDDPMGDIQAAILQASTDPTISAVFVAQGSYGQSVLMGSDDPLTLKGGLDPSCEWDPTDSLTVLTANEQAMIAVGGNSPSITIEGFHLAYQPFSAALSDIQGFALGGNGHKTLKNVRVSTPAMTQPSSVANGAVCLEGTCEIIDSTFEINSSVDGSNGIDSQPGTAIEVVGTRVSVNAGGSLNPSTVLFTGGGTDIIRDSVLTMSGNPGVGRVVFKQGGVLELTNSVVSLDTLSGPNYALHAQDAEIRVVGNLIATPGFSGDRGLYVHSDVADQAHTVVNTAIEAGDGTALQWEDEGGANTTLSLHHNALVGSKLLDASGSVQDLANINSGGFQASGSTSGNIAASCGISLVDTVPSAQCALAGTNPASQGAANEGYTSDFFGNTRDIDGYWTIGPYEGPQEEDHDGDGIPNGVDPDDDADGFPDISDGCPLGEATSGFDSDSDGCRTTDGDCNDNAPTVYPGAPELCDGFDNDCSDDGLPYAPATATVLYVEKGGGGTQGTLASPWDTIAQATVDLVNHTGDVVILVAGGLYNEPVVINSAETASLTSLIIQGSADPNCNWEPNGYTPTQFVSTSDPALNDNGTVDITFRDFDVAIDEAQSASSFTVAHLNGAGSRTYRRMHFTSPTTTQAPGSSVDGLSVLNSSNALVTLDEVGFTLGGADQARGVDALTSIRHFEINNTFVSTFSSGGVHHGFILGATGAASSISNSVVQISGGAGLTHMGIQASGAQLNVLNTIVQISEGNEPRGIYYNGADKLWASGNAFFLPDGGTGVFLLDVGAQHNRVVNCIIDAPNGTAINKQGSGDLTMSHNVINATTLVGGGLNISDLSVLNGCQWSSCGSTTIGNLEGTCPMAGNIYPLSDGICIAAGDDPSTFGISIPGQDLDRTGDPRPGADGQWEIGPDEVQ